MKSRVFLNRFGRILSGAVCLLAASAPAGLIDVWRASDLDPVLTNGQPVELWRSGLGREMSSSTESLRPVLQKNATPAGGSAVRFAQDRLRTTSSPVGGLSSFSIALVFRPDAAGSSGSQWYNNTGIVDAEQGGVTADWGVAINSNGQLAWGCGQPDHTLRSNNGSLVDSNYHVAVVTWGGGEKRIYIDNAWTGSASGVSTATRNSAGMAFGSLLTEVNPFFVGDLVEVRFYDTVLSGTEATNVVRELREEHILNTPVITTFTVSPQQVMIDNPVTVAWSVSNAMSVRILPAPGFVAASGTVQLHPRTNTTYVLTATNLAGTRTREVSVAVNQGIPVASNQVVTVTNNLPRTITLNGSDPQGSNLTYSVITAPAHGSLSGNGMTRTYTPVTGFSGNDQFTFKVNDGEFDSLPGIVTIQVLKRDTPPSGILLSTSQISTGTTPGAFIASLTAADPDTDDSHTFTLVPGYGDNSRFAIVANQLRAGDTFVGALGAVFNIRLRATDSIGYWVEQNFQLTVTSAPQAIVINELHYNPSENTIREEFIELHNPTGVPVDVSTWEISDGVEFQFAQGTVIPANGYLIVAQDPPTISARYGRSAVGPWSGALSGDGEKITLKNSSGNTVDTVDYKAEFPWPIRSDGDGASMALVNFNMDNDLGSSWRPETPPSPGASNAVFASNAAPNIRQVQHSPQSPRSTNDIVITAKVTDPHGVGSVQLQYQLVHPGNYIPAVLPVPVSSLIQNPSLEPSVNPAYTNAAQWTAVPMLDNGAGDDAVANDDVFTATLPPQGHRVLVRYRIVVTDALGASRRAPFEDDPSLNFACYVYDGVPAYGDFGTAALESLPVYTLIARNEDVVSCTAYNVSDQLPQFQGGLAHMSRFAFNWPGTLVYDGVVYDNIRYRLRGANGRYQPGKRNWRFKMNKGNAFASRDQFGNRFPRKWTHITAGKGSNNRLQLTFSLNESVNYFLWNKVGVPAPETVFFHYRVVTSPDENPGPYTGDFWGLNWAQEDYDANFLEAHNLPKGNLYKLVNASFSSNPALDMVGQMRYQGPFAVTNGMDGAVVQSTLLGSPSADWIRAHVDVDNWARYHAICEAVRHYDFWPSANKNAAWYFEPPYNASNSFYGKFRVFPWDTDSTWGSTWNNGYDLVYNSIFISGSQPDLAREYRNVVRNIRDLLFQPDQIVPVIDAYAARLAAFVPADLARWSNAPASSGSYASLTAGSGFVSPGLSGGLPGCVQDMKNFLLVGGSYPWWIDRQTVAAGGWIQRLDDVAFDPSIPAKPTMYYAGQEGFPMNSLTFECLPFSDPNGPATFAGMQWRLAEIWNTNQPLSDPRQVPPLEWDAIWESGTLTAWSNRITIPPQFVQTGKLYRARVRHLDNTGRWSRWSDPVEFSVTAADTLSTLRAGLRFSEIMYNPPAFGSYAADELEFLEIWNQGATALDISGLTFTAGITFTFTNNTIIASGQRLILGRNAAALVARYPGLTVHGIFTGRLDNAGETLRLSTPAGQTVLEVTYEDAPPWPVTADGSGFSLVLSDAVAGTYRPSTDVGGSPGAGDSPSAIPAVVINELLTHSDPPLVDFIELHNPGPEAADVGGWYLSDKPDVPKKFRIPTGTIMEPGGFLVFTQPQYDNAGLDFNLNSVGDEAYLFSAGSNSNLTGYVHGATFGAAENGVAFGRHVNSQGVEDFVATETRTPVGTNSNARVGPVVFSEILFQPPAVGDTENYSEEFLELQNISNAAVPLYSVEYPTNTWRIVNGVTFQFPTNITLPVNGRLLVVSFSPANAAELAAFRSKYAVPEGVPILGPWSGRLDNSGEAIELKKPDNPEPDGSVPMIMVEKVRYGSALPWPASARGNGNSLQRLTLAAFGNDATNWFAGPHSAGTMNPGTTQDRDGDGMPDDWEFLNGTDPFFADAEEDPDLDGLNNLEEWIAGTHPLQPGSVLRVEVSRTSPGMVNVRFQAIANRPYRILAAEDLGLAEWVTVNSVPSATTNRQVDLPLPTMERRFFRVVTP